MPVFNRNLFEAGFDIVPVSIAADANSDIAGDWVNLQHVDRAYYVLMKPAGTAGDDLSILLQQAQDNAGTGAKALNISRLWHKIGTMSSASAWTKVDLTTPTDDLDLVSVNSVDLATDTSPAVIVVEVLAESLDANNGFTHVLVSHEGDDIGNALSITGFWLTQGEAFAQASPLSKLS